MPVRVLIVDDQEPFRIAAKAVIAQTPGFITVGESVSGEDSVAAAGRLRPDLVLMDIVLPGIDGVEAARQITEERPGTVVIMVSTYSRFDAGLRSTDSGLPNFVPKSEFGPRALADAWAARR